MQKIATRVFIYASLTFGTIGVIMILTGNEPGHENYGLILVLSKIFYCSIFVILSSFAVSVASKYLKK